MLVRGKEIRTHPPCDDGEIARYWVLFEPVAAEYLFAIRDPDDPKSGPQRHVRFDRGLFLRIAPKLDGLRSVRLDLRKFDDLGLSDDSTFALVVTTDGSPKEYLITKLDLIPVRLYQPKGAGGFGFEEPINIETLRITLENPCLLQVEVLSLEMIVIGLKATFSDCEE